MNPDVRKQTGERYIALNLQLLLHQLVPRYEKSEVEKALVNEQLGESSNRYFAKQNPTLSTFSGVPKIHQTKQ